jgi:hypothetical protein
MRKLLKDFQKKIQESYFYYFHYVGSQKLCEKHLKTIIKWQDMLENPHHRKVKRLINNNKKIPLSTNKSDESTNNSLENISFDCKLEILRRLNDGLDLVNISLCNKSFNQIVNCELAMWKNLCMFHFHQQNINQLLAQSKSPLHSELIKSKSFEKKDNEDNELDWKSI